MGRHVHVVCMQCHGHFILRYLNGHMHDVQWHLVRLHHAQVGRGSQVTCDMSLNSGRWLLSAMARTCTLQCHVYNM